MKKIIAGCMITILLLLAAATGLFYTHLPVPLGFLAPPAARLLSLLTDSDIQIQGKYSLALGSWLVATVDNGAVVVKGGDGSTVSATITTFETSIHLQSLFKKQLVLDGVTLSGMNLDRYPGAEETSPDGTEQRTGGRLRSFIPSALRSVGQITLSDLLIRIFHPDQEAPVQYRLIAGSGSFGAESPGRLTIDGRVDTIGLQLTLETGPLGNLDGETVSWPFSVHLGYKSIAAMFRGQLAKQHSDPVVEAEFALTGDRWDDLASLYGSEGSTDTPFAAEGSLRLSAGEAKLQISRLQPGGSNLTITGVAKDYGLPEEHYSLSVTGDHLDLDLLNGLIARPPGDRQEKGKPKAVNPTGRDTLVLPEVYPFSSLELVLDLQRLTLAEKSVDDFHFTAVIDHGDIEQATFSAVAKNSSLTGHFSTRQEDGLPRVRARLKSESFDVGSFLSDVHLAEGVALQIAEMSTDLSTKGRTVGELVDHLEFTTTAKDGIYILEDGKTGAKVPVTLHHSTITAAPGAGLRFHLQGEVRNSPIDLNVQFENRIHSQAAREADQVSFSSVITLDAGRIELEGKVPVPVTIEGVTLNCRLTCQQLSDFNTLLNLKLPAVGPMTLEGTLEVVPEGYRLQEVHLDVGTSSLGGDLTFDTTPQLPELTVNLLADKVQLDDFRINQEQPEKVTPPAGTAESKKDIQKSAKKTKRKRNLTDRDVLSRYNARISLEVSDVYSGSDHLGRGRLRIEQQNGTFQVMPLHLDMAGGGGVDLNFFVEPGDKDRRYRLDMNVTDLDYGTVGRWFQPDTDMEGVMNFRTSLEGSSPDFISLMAGASGYLDFSIEPEKLRSGVIDMWAVNLFLYLTPFLTPKNESVINCAAGRFNIEDGLLNQEELLIDTTRIQVAGTVSVDFTRNTIQAAFRPLAKRPQFFSLATPLEVNGKLSDFHAGVPSGAMIGTVIRQVSSAVVVPLQMLFKKNMPKDGTAYCLELYERRTPETVPENQDTPQR